MTERNIIVSGATSGIGRAITKLLVENGDRVTGLVRKKGDLADLGVHELVCDFADPKNVESIFQDYTETVDVFINCAGIMLSNCLAEASSDDITLTMNVNLISPMVVLSRLIHLFSDNSVCLLIGSQSAFKGSYDDLYAVSKAAIHGLVGTVAPKIAPKTRIIDLAPGITLNTRMTLGRTNDDLEPARQRIPMKRFAQPEEVAKVALQLISDDFAYMTGNTVDLNGGNVIR